MLKSGLSLMNFSTVSFVLSAEPSSTIIHSKFLYVCLFSASYNLGRVFALLYDSVKQKKYIQSLQPQNDNNLAFLKLLLNFILDKNEFFSWENERNGNGISCQSACYTEKKEWYPAVCVYKAVDKDEHGDNNSKAEPSSENRPVICCVLFSKYVRRTTEQILSL